MQALTAQQLLSVWESGQTRMPTWRAIALLSAASSPATADLLAELSIGERDAQLLRLREWAFGSRLFAVSDCPKCGERVELAFTGNDIGFGGSIEHPEPLALSVDDYEVLFRLPNSADLMAITVTNEQNAQSELVGRCILEASFQGTDTTPSEFPEIVFDAISREMAAADPQADVQLALDCPKCGHSWKAMFDIVSFFWSEIGAWAKRTLSEVHVLASAYGWREDDILAMSPWRREFYLEMLGA